LKLFFAVLSDLNAWLESNLQSVIAKNMGLPEGSFV